MPRALRLTPSQRGDQLYLAGRWVCLAGFVLLPLFAAYLLLLEREPPYDTIFQKGVLGALLLCASIACFLRGASEQGDRAIWFAFGFGSLMEAFGIFYNTYALNWDPTPPFPSPADAFYLLVYPGWYAGLILLARKHVTDQRLSMWLHGLIGGLACAALAAALVFDKIVSTNGDNAAAVAVSLAYPVADTMLLALVVAVIALMGWRPGLQWALICAGVAVFYAADIIYALGIADGTYQVGDLVDMLWPAGMLLIASAGFVRPKPDVKFRHDTGWMLVPSLLFSGIALALLVYDHGNPINDVAVWLAMASIVLMMIQFALAILENDSLLSRSRDDAVTDHLTGLANRRKLFTDLEELCTSSDIDPGWLMILDLNGFKTYNDRFGHMAGDGLLARLGGRLQAAVAVDGCVAYRFGGDEFCVIGRSSGAATGKTVEAAVTALRDIGEGFETSAAYGVAEAPLDADNPDDLVRIADQRMYAEKHSHGPIDERHLETVVRVIQRYAPIVDTHRLELLPVVRATANAVGIHGVEAERVITAFEVRDIGYYAVPNSMLRKPGPFDDAEWALMRTHPVVGERILALSPSLREVGTIVRSSHERPDGTGYPDRLSEDEIPIGSRVVAVAAAFDAMISRRPYRESVSVEEAVAQIKRHSGTQFDQGVANAFCESVRDSGFQIKQDTGINS